MHERSIDVLARARAAGPLAAGSFRVVTYEPDARVTWRDFTDRALALTYADDAASETETGIVLSYVLDDHLRIVHEGKHY